MNRNPQPARAIAPLPAKRSPYADVARINPVRGHKAARIKPYAVTCRNPHRANNADRYSNRIPFVPTHATPEDSAERMALLPERDMNGRYKSQRDRRIGTPVFSCKAAECRCIDRNHGTR